MTFPDTKLELHAPNEVTRHPVPNVMPEEGSTTLMVRNLPRNYTAQAIMREIDEFSPTSKYDMVYVPWDARRGSNISYAFVNFLDHGSALRAFFALSGRVWSFVRTTKSCKFATAHIQGVPENLATYVANFGMASDCPHAPTVFHNGKHMPWRRAVKLFCTSEMLARAAAAVQSKKLACEALAERKAAEAEAAAANAQSKTQTQIAAEFRENFLRFGETIAENHGKFAGMEHTSPCDDESMAHSEIEFWLRLQDLCHQVSKMPSIMPDLDSTAMVSPPGQDAGSVPVGFVHAPGLIQSKREDNGYAVKSEMVVVPRSFQKNGLELGHDRHRASMWHNEVANALFTRPDEGVIPVPKRLVDCTRRL